LESELGGLGVGLAGCAIGHGLFLDVFVFLSGMGAAGEPHGAATLQHGFYGFPPEMSM